MTLDTEMALKVREMREAAQRREEMERRLDFEHGCLVVPWLSCLFFSVLCIGGNGKEGGIFFSLFFLFSPVPAAHYFLIRPMRRARFARLEETPENERGRERKQAGLRVGDLPHMLPAWLFCISIFLFVGYGFWCAVNGGRTDPEVMQKRLMTIVACAVICGLCMLLFPRREWLAEKDGDAPPERFTNLLVRILVEIARSDGRFTCDELAVILDFCRMKAHHDEARLADLKRRIKRALDNPGDIRRLLETLAARHPYQEHLTAVDLIFRLVHAKNPPLAAELALARDIAAFLKIRPYDLQDIEAKYFVAGSQAEAEADDHERARQAESARERREREREERLKREWEERQRREREERARREQEEARRRAERKRRARFSAKDELAFAILGLEPSAKFAAIKKAYRKLVLQYHPDKVGHLGEEYRRIATEKTKELNAAYRHLEERFGK